MNDRERRQGFLEAEVAVRELAGELARTQQTRQEVESSEPGPSAHEEHSIRFGVDDWNVWRERGNLPGDSLVFISGWRRGDVLYSCTIRLRNNLDWEEQLHRFRADFRKGDQSLLV